MNKTETNKERMVFKEEGSTVVVKQEMPKRIMNSKDVIEQLGSLNKQEMQMIAQIQKFKDDIPPHESMLEEVQKRIKDLGKFKDKMMSIQVSKVKVIYNEIKDEVIKKVDKEYKANVVLGDAQNDRQKLIKLQHLIATHPKMAEEIAPTIIREYLFIDSIIEDHWGGTKKP